MNTPFKNRPKFFIFPLIFLAFILAGGFAVMLLWNSIIPSVIVSVGTLTYTQAIGLLILCRILFGGFRGQGYRGGHRRGYDGYRGWRQKMANMTEEEREKFKAEWKQRCGR
jgi:hypothetical protein